MCMKLQQPGPDPGRGIAGLPGLRDGSAVSLRFRAEGYPSAGGSKIELCFSDLGQLLIRHLFLIEILLQDAGAVAASELLGPSNQRSVTGYLIVLDGLGGRGKRRIQPVFAADSTSRPFGLRDDAV